MKTLYDDIMYFFENRTEESYGSKISIKSFLFSYNYLTDLETHNKAELQDMKMIFNNTHIYNREWRKKAKFIL